MKKILKDFVLGIGAFVSWGIVLFGVKLLFDKFFPADPELSETKLSILFSNRSLMLHLFVVLFVSALLTFIFTWISKTKSRKDALRKSIIWSVIFIGWYIIIGTGNNTIAEIFLSYYFYTVLACYFVGPLVFMAVKKLPKGEVEVTENEK